MRISLIVSIAAALLIGFAIGFNVSLIYQNKLTTIGQYSGAISAVIGVAAFLWNTITSYTKENVFEYGGIYKKQEVRVVYERKGWSLEETERHNETAYYLRIIKKRGHGRLENCEGHITLKEKDGKTTYISTVWEGAMYARYRNISIQDNLKLFHISEDKHQIFLFSHHDDKDSKVPDKIIYDSLNEGALSTNMSIRLGASSGNPPNKPFVMVIGEIIQNAVEG